MLSNQDLRKMFNELDRMTGQNTKSIPVSFNGRLKKSLGRYRFFSISFTPCSFEFSSTLKHMSYDEVKQIVIHEYAHYLEIAFTLKVNSIMIKCSNVLLEV